MSGYDHLANAMRAQASLGQNILSLPRWGVISSYDPNTPAVKVKVQPENDESGWMALGVLGVGNGFGVAVGPNIGDLVLVVFAEGDFNSGTILGRFFSVQNVAIAVPSGEIWAVQQSGSFVKLLASGDVDVSAAANVKVNAVGDITAAAGGNVTVTAGGDLKATASGGISLTGTSITLNGAIALNGPITQTNTAGGATTATLIGPLNVSNDVTAAGKSVSTHTHHENGAGSNTNPPN